MATDDGIIGAAILLSRLDTPVSRGSCPAYSHDTLCSSHLFRACTIWTQALTLAAADTGHKRPRLQDSSGPSLHFYSTFYCTCLRKRSKHRILHHYRPPRTAVPYPWACGREQKVFKMRLSTMDRRTFHRHTMKPVTRSQRRPHPPLQDVLRERREGNRKSGAHDSGALSSGSQATNHRAIACFRIPRRRTLRAHPARATLVAPCAKSSARVCPLREVSLTG